MKTENKELLLKDLCARLPYKPIVEYVLKAFGGGNATMTCTLDTIYLEDLLQDSEDLVHIKPYLRPMSSMTEEEKIELKQEHIKDEQLYVDCIKNRPEMRGKVISHFAADWCDKNMFDYRGLIPAGAAIAVNEKNNPYKD